MTARGEAPAAASGQGYAPPDVGAPAAGVPVVAPVVAPAVAPAAAPAARGWIESAPFDLALFTLAPLAGLLVVLADGRGRPGALFILACTYFVGIPHYLASFTFFLGDDNLAYYRTRWLAFFLGPALIGVAVFALRFGGQHGVVQASMFLWNVWHVSLQSAGILTIYRRLNGGPPAEHRLAKVTLVAVNATLALWYLDRFPPLYEPVVRVSAVGPLLIRAVLLPAALGAAALLAWRIARRPRRLSLPEGAFLASSLLLFHPYLWVRDANVATFAMLMGHFIQYLAIVWLAHRRRYVAASGSRRQQLLGAVSRRPALLAGALVLSGGAFLALQKVAALAGAPLFYVAIWNALTLMHFYLDGLIWAFRKPFVRDSLGRALMPASRVAAG